jgi:hypothetical protein
VYVKLGAACVLRTSCPGAGVGCRIVSWSADHTIARPANPTNSNGTKALKCHSKFISAASAADDSGFLPTALSKTPNYRQLPEVCRRGVSDRVLTFFVHKPIFSHEPAGFSRCPGPRRRAATWAVWRMLQVDLISGCCLTIHTGIKWCGASSATRRPRYHRWPGESWKAPGPDCPRQVHRTL